MAGVVTAIVVAAMVVLLARGAVAPSLAAMGALLVLLLARVLDLNEALGGFAGAAPVTAAALALIARAVEKSGIMRRMLSRALGAGGGARSNLVRALVPTAAFSAFLPSSRVASSLAPCALEWAARRERMPWVLLMPLAFAALLGGMVTVMGTSANILVSALLEARGDQALGLFEIGRAGLPVALAGTVTLVMLAPLLLRERAPARRQLEEGGRQFTLAMRVVPGGPLDGQAVEAGGLRHLQGMFLMAVERGGYFVAPVGPQLVLRGGDILTFVGRADLVVDLQTTKGLVAAERAHVAHFDTSSHQFFEAVIGAASPLVGRNLSEVSFRSRYQAAVVAVHRAGERMHAKLSEIRLRRGDTLFLLADPGFAARWSDAGDFLTLHRVVTGPVAGAGGAAAGARERAAAASAGLPTSAAMAVLVPAAVVALAGTGLLALPLAAMAGAGVLVAARGLSRSEIRGAIELDSLVQIGAASGLAAAVERSGLAEVLARPVEPLVPAAALAAVAIAVVALTQLVPNVLAAALAFPVAMTSAELAGGEPRTFAIAVAVAASASFLSPFACRPNTVVCGPGGYRFADFRRLGWPVAIVAVAVLVLALL